MSCRWKSTIQGLTRKSVCLWFSATWVLPLFIGCATVPETGRKELILIPESQELALGVKSYRVILRKSKLSQDQEIGEMVRRIGGNLARVTSRDYPIAQIKEWMPEGLKYYRP